MSIRCLHHQIPPISWHRKNELSAWYWDLYRECEMWSWLLYKHLEIQSRHLLQVSKKLCASHTKPAPTCVFISGNQIRLGIRNEVLLARRLISTNVAWSSFVRLGWKMNLCTSYACCKSANFCVARSMSPWFLSGWCIKARRRKDR